jgi:hypothetical protein
MNFSREYFLLTLSLAILSACSDSNEKSGPLPPAQNIIQTLENTDASQLLSNAEMGFEKQASLVILGSGVIKGEGIGRQQCFTGDVVKMDGLAKIVYQIESNYNEELNVWSYYMAAYRIQSIAQLVNAKPNEYLRQFFGAEDFLEECGRHYVNKVFSGQRIHFQAKIVSLQDYVPSALSFFGTSQPIDLKSFIQNYESTFINFQKGNVTIEGTSAPRLQNTARLLVHTINETAKQGNLDQQTLPIYGMGEAPKP